MTEVNSLLALTTAQTVLEVAGNPLVQVPDGYRVQDLEDYLPAPRRMRQRVVLLSAASFIAYCVRFANTGTTILADSESNSLQAVIDHAVNSAEPTWNDHRASYSCELSKAWKIWQKYDGQTLGQEQFAELLEDRAADVVNPTGAELLEIATKFQVIRKAIFGSAMRLATGEFQFNYSDENEKGTIEVPELITLGLAPFHNGESYEVQARLRYRLREGKLTFTFKLVNPERVVEDAFNSIVDKVKEGVSVAHVLDGYPID
ncbi:DUF2303 family protein [Yersinia enterocolitica]